MKELWYTLVYSRDKDIWYAEITDRLGKEIAVTGSYNDRHRAKQAAKRIIKSRDAIPHLLSEISCQA